MSLTALVTNVLTNDTIFNQALDSASYHLVFRIFGGVTILTTISTFLLDIFLLLYFLQCRRTTSTKIYSILLIADFCISISGVFISYDLFTYQTFVIKTLYKGEDLYYFEDQFLVKRYLLARLCNSFVFAIGSRVSAMLNCVLSVIRAIAICFPFYAINCLSILQVLLSYTVIWAVAIIAFYSLTDYVSCSDLYFVCEPKLNNTSILVSMSVFVGVPFAVPCLPVLVSCIVIIVTLLKEGKGHKKSTGTILLLSATFLVCNGSFVIVNYVTGPPAKTDDRKAAIIQFYTLKTFSVFANAFFNAIILMTRSSGVQGFVYRLREGQLTIETFTHPERARRSTAAISTGLQQRNLQLQELQNRYADNRPISLYQNNVSHIEDNGTSDVACSEEGLQSVPRISNSVLDKPVLKHVHTVSMPINC